MGDISILWIIGTILCLPIIFVFSTPIGMRWLEEKAQEWNYKRLVKKYGKEKADSITNPEMNLRQSLMWLLLIITGGIFVIDTLYFDGALLYSIFN